MRPSPGARQTERETILGVAAALGAYGIWGISSLFFAAVAEDQQNALGIQVPGLVQDVAEHRSPTERVQDLGQPGTHARPLAGGQNHDGSIRSHGKTRRRVASGAVRSPPANRQGRKRGRLF